MRREGMTWGENRLALLVHAPNCLVWTVRESQVTPRCVEWIANGKAQESGKNRMAQMLLVGK